MDAELDGTVYTPVATAAVLVPAESLVGDAVVNAQGDELGRVADVLLDMRGGRIGYVVVSAGGFLGIADQRVPVPWSVLRRDAAQGCFVIDRDRLEP